MQNDFSRFSFVENTCFYGGGGRGFCGGNGLVLFGYSGGVYESVQLFVKKTKHLC